MELIAMAVGTLFALFIFPRLTLTALAFVLHPVAGVVVGGLSLVSLFVD